MRTVNKLVKRLRRIKSIQKRLHNASYPRIVVMRSNSHIYAQLIDDLNHKTIAASSDLKIKGSDKMKPAEVAKEVGIDLAKQSVKLSIDKVVFDRRGFGYQGRVKALADGAREGGLKF